MDTYLNNPKIIIVPKSEMQKNQPYNTSAIVCYTSADRIALFKDYPNLKKEKSSGMLIIDRKTGSITLQSDFSTNKFYKRNFSAFLGIAYIEVEKFAVFCDEVKTVCTVSGFVTYEISSLFFLSFKDQRQIKKLDTRKEIYSKIRDLNVLLTYGFYFSHEYNLTRTFEYQKLDCLYHFVWNNVFLKPLGQFQDWQTPIIQGFVSQFQIFLQSTRINYILISRRSLKKGGTRYFDRGINDDGYVANFVETEQIVKINEITMSDLQIRGNVPIFFEQKGLTTKVKITRGYELTHDIYQKYVEKMIRSYERIFWVNLLCEAKSGELILIKDLQRHIKEDRNKNIKYFFYDFHKMTGHTDFQKVDEGVEKLRQIRKSLRFFIYDEKNDQVVCRQWGVFRTNCLDCLDRTNFFQAKLGMIAFEEMLSAYNILFEQSLVKLMNDPSEESSEIVNFRKIWARNGDQISYHYTGTGSTHSDIIDDGKRGFFGIFKHKYKSVSRFYNQNFWDFYKMRLIDELLDEKVSEMENTTLPNIVNSRQAQFCQKLLMDIYIFSWKVPKKPPTSLPLFPNSPDIIAISLQQVSNQQTWQQLLIQSIDSNSYIQICEKISSHNLLTIYAKRTLKQAIHNVETTKVKFKSLYNQYLSTKCSVLVRFDLYNTRICFVGCQLQFGREYETYRVANLKDLHRFGFKEVAVGQKESESIVGDDVVFLFGNMNTNVSPSYKSTIQDQFRNLQSLTLQHRRLITEIIETDQFPTIQQHLLQYRFYQEQAIKFPPTYKYQKQKQSFDGEVSGWPDRIWYSTEKKIICSKYNVIEELREEHVPVFGSYQLEIQKIDELAHENVSEEIFDQFVKSAGFIVGDDLQEDDFVKAQ